ncbi:MAG: hypothetical protein H6Q89_1470 [Myxococcaceae bacterium]|nr:hypothetical protein [Myxococcaceae bacterium]
MGTPIDPDFEALAEKLGARHEPEPVPPLPVPVIQGRGGVPEQAIEKLQEIAKKGPRAPVNPFGANVEVSDDE